MNKVVYGFIAILAISLGILIYIGSQKNSDIITQVSGEEARQILNEQDNALLVDVRTREEYEENGIDGSQLIPVDTIESTVETIITDKDTPIIVYCRSGNRSSQAADILKELGYTKIYDLGARTNW